MVCVVCALEGVRQESCQSSHWFVISSAFIIKSMRKRQWNSYCFLWRTSENIEILSPKKTRPESPRVTVSVYNLDMARDLKETKWTSEEGKGWKETLTVFLFREDGTDSEGGCTSLSDTVFIINQGLEMFQFQTNNKDVFSANIWPSWLQCFA